MTRRYMVTKSQSLTFHPLRIEQISMENLEVAERGVLTKIERRVRKVSQSWQPASIHADGPEERSAGSILKHL